jgi:hypothetical protein
MMAVVTVGAVTIGTKPAVIGIVVRRRTVAVVARAEAHGLRMHSGVVAMLAGLGVVNREIARCAEHGISVAKIRERETESARARTNFLGSVVSTPAKVLLQIWSKPLAVTTDCESTSDDSDHGERVEPGSVAKGFMEGRDFRQRFGAKRSSQSAEEESRKQEIHSFLLAA